MKLPLEKGADVGFKDGVGQTPLSRATRYGHEAVVNEVHFGVRGGGAKIGRL